MIPFSGRFDFVNCGLITGRSYVQFLVNYLMQRFKSLLLVAVSTLLRNSEM